MTSDEAAESPWCLDALCIGETMAMISPEQAESLETAHTVVIRAGGAESNVAMYLAGLGHRVSWMGRLGDDPLGRRILHDISTVGVDTTLVELDPGAPTGVFFKDPGPDQTRVFYYRKGSAASFMGPQVVTSALHKPPRVIHTTGITPALSPQCDAMVSELITGARTNGVAVSFDVNFRHGLWSPATAAPRLLDLAQQADIVFVGMDEAIMLWDVEQPNDLRQLFDKSAVVVAKDDALGATVLHDGSSEFVPSLKVAVNEPVGAGDAFAAGWLSGFLRDLPHSERLRLGHIVASCALASTADYQALPPETWMTSALSLDETDWADLTLSSSDAWMLDPSLAGGD